MMQKPFSQACENNKRPILEVLQQVLPEHQYSQALMLEVGSGTGQHAAFFASHLPWLCWQPTDQAEYLPGCRLWVEEAQAAGAANLQPPLVLDVLQPDWPVASAQAAFSANTAHIMSWPAVKALFAGLGERLAPNAVFCLYGPFRYHGKHTSASNEQFDRHLRDRDPAMGIRDLDELTPLAEASGFRLEADHAMPANNRTLIWRRQ
ncbi:MAG: class I SAM-dependent methyltransferase [Saccharospirillum sp.]|nr:class I SAM-dependent methyltransferase [Saccharospirillum sp.]